MIRWLLIVAAIMLLVSCGPSKTTTTTVVTATANVAATTVPAPVTPEPAAPTSAPETPTEPAVAPTEEPSAPTPEPTTPPTSDSGVTFTTVTGAAPGDDASATVQTTPGTECDLEYTTPSGTQSSARGLGRETADDSGVVTWTWKIGINTDPGTGTVFVTCGDAQAHADIQIGS